MGKKPAEPAKAPKLFAAEIPRRRFERLILGRIYVSSEREFLLGLYAQQAEDPYRRPEELSGEQLRRLRELAKSIKRNRGVVQGGKLAILVVLAAAALIFSLFFKNRLAEQAFERALEGVFAARAEVTGLELRLLAGELSFERLVVADRDAPMRNLFELGWTQAALDTPSLLRRRFVVENVETRDLEWNTARSSSGALEPRGERADREGPGVLARTASTVLGRLDAGALLEQEAAALSSPGRVEAVSRELAALGPRWAEQVAGNRRDLQAVAGRIEALRGIDVGAIGTLREAQGLAAELRELVPEVRRLEEDLSAVEGSLKGDLAAAEAMRREAERAIEADVAFLRSRLDLSGGGLKELATSVSARALEQLLGGMYRHVLRVRDYARALGEGQRRQRKDRPLRRAGRDIAFPAEQLPRFVLRRLALSMADPPTAGSIRDLSSDPDLLGRPVVFDFSRSEARRSVAVEGFLDGRSRRTEDFGLKLRVDNQPFAVTEGLEGLNLSAVGGTLHLTTELTLDRDGRMRGEGVIELPELSAQSAVAGDLVSTTIVETLDGLATGVIRFRYAAEAENRVRLELTSNLDDLLARRLTARLAALEAEYGVRLRSALEERLGGSLRENALLYAALEELNSAAGGNLAAAEAYQRVVAAKQQELEGKVAELQKRATDSLKKEAEKQLEEVTDRLQLPRLTF